ncbi:hypothetical protein SERLA73DRAFT_156337 [Serpula lacrymans var. lacrymans S7.3]|uniref:Uncharacterized protein n=1 Tax=Serpula lacrymans var. lacrymans (strain S7.3) TaxID=936435 RepID=F8QE14_SERL3|nr:hypothetical protein SERLA73DRAFT_156337 [Serpula lacrymans var. lacrymans S7.3]
MSAPLATTPLVTQTLKGAMRHFAKPIHCKLPLSLHHLHTEHMWGHQLVMVTLLVTPPKREGRVTTPVCRALPVPRLTKPGLRIIRLQWSIGADIQHGNASVNPRSNKVLKPCWATGHPPDELCQSHSWPSKDEQNKWGMLFPVGTVCPVHHLDCRDQGK